MALSVKGKRRGRHRSAPISEINVTPFVDVMLVLLIIFMVASPLLNTGVNVELPESEAAALPSEAEPPLALTVTADGTLYLQADPVTREDLIPTLADLLSARESDKIYLRADGKNSYSSIFEIMGLLSSGGYNNIGLVGDIPTVGQ